MQTFVVVLDSDSLTEPLVERLGEHYPDFHQFSNHVFFLSSKHDLTSTVAQKLGIKGENRVEELTGAVFGLNGGYAGYTDRSLWEWFGRAKEAE